MGPNIVCARILWFFLHIWRTVLVNRRSHLHSHWQSSSSWWFRTARPALQTLPPRPLLESISPALVFGSCFFNLFTLHDFWSQIEVIILSCRNRKASRSAFFGLYFFLNFKVTEASKCFWLAKLTKLIFNSY